jgi:hypothetical protein
MALRFEGTSELLDSLSVFSGIANEDVTHNPLRTSIQHLEVKRAA